MQVEMGQQTSRRSSSNFKMQNPGLKMQNGVERRNWFYLHLLDPPPYFEMQAHLKRGFQHTEQLFTLPEHL